VHVAAQDGQRDARLYPPVAQFFAEIGSRCTRHFVSRFLRIGGPDNPFDFKPGSRMVVSNGSIADEPYRNHFYHLGATSMKWQKFKVDRVVVLATTVGAVTTVMAWQLPDLTAMLWVGWMASAAVVSRFRCSGPQSTPGYVNELRRSSIDECACGQDAAGVIHDVCSALMRAANRS